MLEYWEEKSLSIYLSHSFIPIIPLFHYSMFHIQEIDLMVFSSEENTDGGHFGYNSSAVGTRIRGYR